MPLKVLFLDDEPALCEIFADDFSSETIQVSTFTEPNLAIEHAKQHPPDLIFIDYRLPGTTGDEVAQLMAPGIPKYLITGDIRVKTNYAFAAVFTKPASPKEILAIFSQFMAGK